MEIKVAPIQNAMGLIKDGWATHAISLVDPGTVINETAPLGHLILHFRDSNQGDFKPQKEHVKTILDFTKALPSDANLVVHCHLALGRSPAAAIAILTQSGATPESSVAQIGNMRPWMEPNKIILKYADDLLGLNGELLRIVENWISERDSRPSTGLIITG